MAAAVGVSAAALVVAACGGGTSSGGNDTQTAAKGGSVSIAGCTPQAELYTGNTNEVCGGTILDAVTAKLVAYNTDTSQPENDIAQSIDTSDNQHFTVKLKPGYKFSDGTTVKAENFVNAWNWNAYCKNGQANAYFFAPIQGYDDLQSDDECKATPKSKKMSGLKVVDDTSFTITTTEKVSNLPLRLGYVAFSPLPDSFFASDAAREKQKKFPVGAGPFKVTGNTTTDITLEKNPNYSGIHKPHIDKLDYKIYTDPSAAYNDVLANNLDFTGTTMPIPSDQLVGDQWKSDLQGRNGSKPSSVFTYITFSPIDKQLKGNLKLRQAISEAIDRDTIIKQIFNGSYTKATGWVSPVVDGYKPGTCGAACDFDPAKAKADYQAAGGYKGTLVLTYNADGGHKGWSEAAANSIKNTLGLNVVAKPVPDFKSLLDQLDKDEIGGMFRNGWVMDYPSIENYLAPIYATGVDSNYARYSSAKFDAQLKKAAASDTGQANAEYQKAEQILAADFPTAPLWFEKTDYGWSEHVTDVKVDAFQQLDLSAIRVKQ
jgi:oligopeptide transport system substrate-binding protein